MNRKALSRFPRTRGDRPYPACILAPLVHNWVARAGDRRAFLSRWFPRTRGDRPMLLDVDDGIPPQRRKPAAAGSPARAGIGSPARAGIDR